MLSLVRLTLLLSTTVCCVFSNEGMLNTLVVLSLPGCFIKRPMSPSTPMLTQRRNFTNLCLLSAAVRASDTDKRAAL